MALIIRNAFTGYRSDFGDIDIINFPRDLDWDEAGALLHKAKPALDDFAARLYEAGGAFGNYQWDYSRWERRERPYQLTHTAACVVAVENLGGDGARAGWPREKVRAEMKAEIERIQADPPLNVV